jgi:hypothetical protein
MQSIVSDDIKIEGNNVSFPLYIITDIFTNLISIRGTIKETQSAFTHLSQTATGLTS